MCQLEGVCAATVVRILAIPRSAYNGKFVSLPELQGSKTFDVSHPVLKLLLFLAQCCIAIAIVVRVLTTCRHRRRLPARLALRVGQPPRQGAAGAERLLIATIRSNV